MTKKFLRKITSIAEKRGYALYYPCAGPFGYGTKNWLGVAYIEPQYENDILVATDNLFVLVVDAADLRRVQRVIKNLPKAKVNKVNHG